MADKIAPIRPTDDDARNLAQHLVPHARHGALGVLDPARGGPAVSRVGIGTAPDGSPITLVSELSHHTRALEADARCSLLLIALKHAQQWRDDTERWTKDLRITSTPISETGTKSCL